MRAAALLLAVALASCADVKASDETFFVVHKDAAMPVWVTGNWRSNQIIVHVHGGPGTTNGIYFQKRSYQRLAERYGIAYYEQRLSGSAQGNSRANLSVPQFVEDLDVVLTVLSSRYPEAQFLLMGHSWGGYLGISYLLDPAHQKKVVGWIEQDGAHDVSCANFDWAAQQVIARKPDTKPFYDTVWKCDLSTNQNNLLEPYQGKQVYLQHSLNVRAVGGYEVDPNKTLTGSETAESIFGSSFDLLAVTVHSPLPMPDFYGTSLTPRLPEVKLPTLVLWGTHDLITPHINAQPAFEAYGAPAARKELVLFDNSGHNPWAEEQERFFDAVDGFIRRQIWP